MDFGIMGVKAAHIISYGAEVFVSYSIEHFFSVF